MKMEPATIDAGIKPLAESRTSGTVNSVLQHRLLLVVADLSLGIIAYVAAWVVRLYLTLPLTQALLPQERWAVVEHPWIVLIVSQVLLLYLLGLYDDLRHHRYREIVAAGFVACVAQIAVITSIFFFTEQVFPRTVLLLFDLFNFTLLVSWRSFVKSRLSTAVRPALIVATDPEAANEIIEDIRQSPWMGLKVCGILVREMSSEAARNLPVLGKLSEIDDVVARYQIEEIIFAAGPTWRDDVLDQLSRSRQHHRFGIAILPSVFDMAIGKLRHINIHDTPLIEVKQNPNEPFERFVKRSFDLTGAALGLLVLAPVLFGVALAIKLSSRGPVLYRQQRVGLGGRVFLLNKFRTMIPDAEKKTGATYASVNDPRVTWMGRILRRTRLDELPQLINVLKGDMSFIGPRPERPGFVKDFEVRVPGYAERHKVKPGITGLAQVRGYYHTRAENKLKYDLAYIYNYNFSLDLLILLETAKVMIGRRGT